MKPAIIGSVVLIVAAVAYMLLGQGGTDAGRIASWPDSLVSAGYRYCDASSYQTCKKGAWFGVIRDGKLEEFSPAARLATNGLIDVACQPRSDPPTSRQLRVIEVEPNRNLVLCRLRDPVTIDRGKILMHAEKSPYNSIRD